MMKAVHTCEMSVYFFETTWHYPRRLILKKNNEPAKLDNILCLVIYVPVFCIFSSMDNVSVSKVLGDVGVISVKITFGEIQMKNAMVSQKDCFIGS
jgi:hypothetical protein